MIPLLPSCSNCVLWGPHKGFVPAEAGGTSGVLIVLEAAVEADEIAGQPAVSKGGHYLFSQLAKAGLQREDFWIHTVLSCRPPENRLANQPYEAAAIEHCAPNLDRTIADHRAMCERQGRHQTILALGRPAFKRIMGLREGDPLLKEDYHGYVHHSERYDCWVLSADHPFFLMRGQHQYVPLLQFAAQRAVEVARDGFRYHEPVYYCDPTPTFFREWVGAYQSALGASPADTFLSFDIETPMKAKKGEDALVREDDEDYIILRCSFAYSENEAVSIPWHAEYMEIVEGLFADPRNQLVGWNLNYDTPRVRHQMPVCGTQHDAMLAWHVLNSALDKRLGFVAPFYAKDARLWKHLSGSRPAWYNAQDADMALRIYRGVRRDLIAGNQWGTFDRHVIQLNKVLDAMSAAGLKRDEEMRSTAEVKLTALLQATEIQIQAAVPQDARRIQVYKTKPRKLDGVKVREVEALKKVCPWCKMVKPPKAHFAFKKKKANVCAGLEAVEERVVVQEWYRELEWKPSTVQLNAYQKSLAQNAVKNRDGRVTFDDNALRSLMKKYPKDLLYKHLGEFRRIQKLRSTYIGITQPDGRVNGGLNVTREGLICCEYTHNPSTLRLACQSPNLTNLPRVGDADSLESIVRNLIIARDGHTFIERDFSAIESVLTAYFARWKDGIRLAKIGVHAYLASHVLGRPADLSWSDADIRKYLKEIKGSDDPDIKRIYNACKRCVHGSNYGMSPRKMVLAEPDTFHNDKFATQIQDIYFEVAAPIRKWHIQTQLDAHTNGFLRNPFGYILRFTHVFRHAKENGKWVRKPGDQANEALAFLPQSTAAGIIKEAMLRLAADPTTQPHMRLMVHDSLLLEVPTSDVAAVDAVLKREMERPIPELVLPDSYKLGKALSIDTDGKHGQRWGSMHG